MGYFGEDFQASTQQDGPRVKSPGILRSPRAVQFLRVVVYVLKLGAVKLIVDLSLQLQRFIGPSAKIKRTFLREREIQNLKKYGTLQHAILGPWDNSFLDFSV